MQRSKVAVRIGVDEVQERIEQLLIDLGSARINSVAYDTAWTARVAQLYPKAGFDNSLQWLREAQHDDGSWGGDVVHYHDRVISTLAAMVTLRSLNDHPADERRIRKAEAFLWREYLRLGNDAHDTIGFPVLAVTLTEEAALLGLDTPKNLFFDSQSVEKKLQILNSSPHLWRKSTMSFSLEAVRSCFPDQPDFLESNGSVGTSPAATAALLLRSTVNCREAFDYLQGVVTRQSDGGTPDVSPIDTFETAWSLNYLRLAGAISADHPEVRRSTDWLWNLWSPRHGIGFSSRYSIPNSDDSSVTFAMLNWAGYDVNPSVFGYYEEEDHFRCFPGELNPSLSANLRMIAALRPFNDATIQAWVSKALLMVQDRWAHGNCWWDKWHCSPFYLTCIVIHSLAGMPERLERVHETRVSILRIVKSYVNWLSNSQHKDGGWGYYGWSTIEETSYAMLSLLHAIDHGLAIDPSLIRAGGKYLMDQFEERYFTPLWLGKCLYSPENVDEAVRLAACWKYLQWEQNCLSYNS